MEKRPDRLELIVGLDPQGEPISGCVTDPQGQRRTFSGWLDLMDILDGARHQDQPDPIVDTPHQPGGTK
jgi:hypothetical protein